MALAFKQDFTKSTLALAAITGPTLTFARASSTAEAFNSSGVLTTIADGVPRLAAHTYNGSSWVNRGILIEEVRENICLRSEEFGTTWTVNANADITANTTAAPDGETTGDTLAATTTDDLAFAVYQAFTGRTQAESTTCSCFVKAGTNATLVQLAYDSDGSGADGFFCNFNLSTGALGTVTLLGAGTATVAYIEDVSNGWYRCSIVGSIATGTAARFTISIVDIITAAGFEAANLADNDSIICWGAAVEADSLYSTSYIPTTTAAVTRAVETLTTTDLTWMNSDASGTWVELASKHNIDPATTTVVRVDDDGNDNYYWSGYLGGAGLNRFVEEKSATTTYIGNYAIGAVGTIGVDDEEASAVDTDDWAASFNGATVETDSGVTLPVGVTTLRVGHGRVGSAYLDGFIKHLRYWDTRESNVFLAAPDPFGAPAYAQGPFRFRNDDGDLGVPPA